MKKRIVSLLLCLVMALSMLPGTAWASVGDLLRNTPAENQALLDELAAMTGGTTEEARAMLEQLGLLDENGQLKTDYTLSLNGKEYTLDEAEALLEDPDTDLSPGGLRGSVRPSPWAISRPFWRSSGSSSGFRRPTSPVRPSLRNPCDPSTACWISFRPRALRLWRLRAGR